MTSHTESTFATHDAELDLRPARIRTEELLLLGLLTCLAVALHGYHGGVEDAEIYLPGVLKHLHPDLFPRNSEFFNSHAGMTLFPTFMAASIRLVRLPAATVMLLWHVATIFGLLVGCFRIARLCFTAKRAVWCGVSLVASLLTLPVAGTALYIMDQYVTSRSFSTAASVLALACVLERRYGAAAGWTIFTALVHPLMSVFLVTLAGILVFFDRVRVVEWEPPAACSMVLFPPVSAAYREVLRSHPYFLLSNWTVYERLGIVGPLAIFLAMAMLRPPQGRLPRLLQALVAFETLFAAAALFVSRPGPLERFAELQPLRCLLLVYILLFLLGGCLLGELVLGRRMWRWALLFGPLCAGMAMAQVRLFPDSSHLEWPWQGTRNEWAAGFEWVRTHTPEDAYFALDPDYERLPGEDVHGFRAIARRSMLADNGKDSGAVSMFPMLADEWSEQVNVRRGWKQFERPDFLKLKARFGVDWVVLQKPGARGLTCPYQNDYILVCRIE
jgi:hypothetical protein